MTIAACVLSIKALTSACTSPLEELGEWLLALITEQSVPDRMVARREALLEHVEERASPARDRPGVGEHPGQQVRDELLLMHRSKNPSFESRRSVPLMANGLSGCSSHVRLGRLYR